MGAPTVRGKRTVTFWNHARAIALLPVMNTIAIPGVLLSLTNDWSLGWLARPGSLGFAVALAAFSLLVAGLTLVAGTIGLFVARGRGTLAPWDPTQRLVLAGPYRYIRNPMKLGLFLILLAEALLLQSGAIAIWFSAFATVNVLYIRWSEEPGLVKRFGAEYLQYRRDVPAWIPWLEWPAGHQARHEETGEIR